MKSEKVLIFTFGPLFFTFGCECRDLRKFINTNIYNKNNNKSHKITIITNNGEEVVGSRNIANVFNNYYANIASKLTNNIQNDDLINFESKINKDTFFLQPTNYHEILSIINKLKNKVSPGIDNISNNIIKNIGAFIADPIAHIFNLSIEKSVYPKAFKLSVVVPIFKTGSKLHCNNYKPISLTTNLSKIFEKLLKSRIITFLNKCKFLSNRQYGFRDEYSTTDAINYLTETIYGMLDKKKQLLQYF